MSHHIERLDTASLDTTNLDMMNLGLPPARVPGLVRHFYRSARRLLRSIIARIDLSCSRS